MQRPSTRGATVLSRQDLYARTTASIIADLERGVRTWMKLWSVEHLAGHIGRPLRSNGEPYRGINVLLLWSEAAARGFASPVWMTFRQALTLGAHVRKGEKGATVVYANSVVRTDTDPDGAEVERQVPFLKAYTVFNLEQMEGLSSDVQVPVGLRLDPPQRIGRAEAFFSALGGDVRHGGDMAYYALTADHVQMPPFEAFASPEDYYATLAHEFTHWTRHPTRLDRSFGRHRFGDASYAREELVAELGAAFLCADLGLDLVPREDHAAYLSHWLEMLQLDPRFLFSAAGHAQRACDFLHALQPKT